MTTVFADQDLAVTPKQYAKIKDLELEHWHDQQAFCDAVEAMFPEFDFKPGTGTVTRIVVVTEYELAMRREQEQNVATASGYQVATASDAKG